MEGHNQCPSNYNDPKTQEKLKSPQGSLKQKHRTIKSKKTIVLTPIPLATLSDTDFLQQHHSIQLCFLHLSKLKCNIIRSTDLTIHIAEEVQLGMSTTEPSQLKPAILQEKNLYACYN